MADVILGEKDVSKKVSSFAISVIFALPVSLKMMLEEGLANIITRHAWVADAARKGVESLGLSLYWASWPDA